MDLEIAKKAQDLCDELNYINALTKYELDREPNELVRLIFSGNYKKLIELKILTEKEINEWVCIWAKQYKMIVGLRLENIKKGIEKEIEAL